MAWKITQDLIENGRADETVSADYDDELQKVREPSAGPELGQPRPFRMLDGDGNIYYYGFTFGDDDGFGPLDDFGQPNAGCTSIQYKIAGKWEEL